MLGNTYTAPFSPVSHFFCDSSDELAWTLPKIEIDSFPVPLLLDVE